MELSTPSNDIQLQDGHNNEPPIINTTPGHTINHNVQHDQNDTSYI